MKKIFKYIFAGMAAMSVVACSEDALETSPSSSVSVEYMQHDLALAAGHGKIDNMRDIAFAVNYSIRQLGGHLLLEVVGQLLHMGVILVKVRHTDLARLGERGDIRHGLGARAHPARPDRRRTSAEAGAGPFSHTAHRCPWVRRFCGRKRSSGHSSIFSASGVHGKDPVRHQYGTAPWVPWP